MNWILISDKLPEEGKPVLVHGRNPDKISAEDITLAKRIEHKGKDYWYVDDTSIMIEVDAWMELPKWVNGDK